MSPACKTPWCVALALPDGVHCGIHRKQPDFRTTIGPVGECEDCDGSGECEHCNGDGDCVCDCGDQHDCHECDGTGKCQTCSRDTFRQTTWDEKYLAFAFDPGWQPFDPEAAYRELR